MSTWTPSDVSAEERQRIVEVEAGRAVRVVPEQQAGADVELHASAPASAAAASASMLFSGATAAAPRWPITSGRPSPRRTISLAQTPEAAERASQIPNVVWISRQAVSEKRTVRKMSSGEHDPEASVRAARGVLPLAARVAARPLTAVRALDRRGVERGGIVVQRLGARRRLGHRCSVKRSPGSGHALRARPRGTHVRLRATGSIRPAEAPYFAPCSPTSSRTRASRSRPAPPRPVVQGIWGSGDRIVWLAAFTLTLSTLMGWYSGDSVGVKLAVIGWNTGVLGKLVFFIGFAALAIVILREFGVELPRVDTREPRRSSRSARSRRCSC